MWLFLQRVTKIFLENLKPRRKDEAFALCAEHVRQLGGGSPLFNLVEVKD
jgi:hypothetical protein